MPPEDPPVVTPPPAPVTPPAQPTPVSMTSEALKTRLDESRAAGGADMLKSLGFKSAEDATKFVAEQKKAQEAQLTAQELLKKQNDELKPKADRGERVETLLKTIVDERFGKLPESAQKIIDATAKGDTEQRLALMQLAEAMAPVAASAPLGALPPNPPANVTPPAAPPPAGQTTKFQDWQSMRAKSPVLGDIFYQSNMRDIESSRPAS